MNQSNTYAVSTRSVMEVAVLDGGERLAIAFLGGSSQPVNVSIPLTAALDLASKIMQADIEAARDRLRRREFGDLARLLEAEVAEANLAAMAAA